MKRISFTLVGYCVSIIMIVTFIALTLIGNKILAEKIMFLFYYSVVIVILWKFFLEIVLVFFGGNIIFSRRRFIASTLGLFAGIISYANDVIISASFREEHGMIIFQYITNTHVSTAVCISIIITAAMYLLLNDSNDLLLRQDD